MGLPQELAFVGACEAQGINADEYAQGFEGDVGAEDEIFEAEVVARLLALADDGFGYGVFEGFDVDKTEIDVGAIECGEHEAMVYAGQMDGAAGFAGFVEIDARGIEAAEIVDDGYHKLQGIIGLEEEALETLHGIACRMGFAEAVACKRFDLSPHFFAQSVGILHGAAMGIVFLGDFVEVFFVARFAAHHTSQYIGISQIQTAKMMPHLQHIFLIDHHAVGFFQLFFHDGMQIGEVVGMMKAMDKLFHHAAFGNARAYDGTGCHEGEIVVAMKFFQQTAHGGAFDIEAADGVARFQLLAHEVVGFEFVHLMNIHLDATVLINDFGGILDVSDAALTQDVEFLEADVFCQIHVELGGGKTFWRHVEGGVGGDGFFGNQDAPRVDAAQVGKILNGVVVRHDVATNFALIEGRVGELNQAVDVLFGQPIHFAHFADDGTVFEG